MKKKHLGRMPPRAGLFAQVTPAGDTPEPSVGLGGAPRTPKLLSTLGLREDDSQVCRRVTLDTERVSGCYGKFRFVNE